MIDLASLGAEAVEFHRALLRLDTSNPPGNELPAARYVADVLGRAGLETRVFDYGSNRGSCVARLRGDGSQRPLLMLSHVDVVPVEPARWTQPPFGAEIVDGYLYGRGAIDNKLTTAMHMAVAVEAARQRLPLRRDLIVAATSGEEDGGPDRMFNGATRLTREHPDLIDAEYGFSEGGGWAYVIDGKPFYTCQVGEKGGWGVEVVARGRPGHAAVPHHDQAVVRLGEALVRLGTRKMPLHVTASARAFFEGAARASSPETARLLRDLLDPARHDAAIAAVPVDEPTRGIFHALLHNTATPTILTGGVKSNVIPSEVRATLSARPLPGIDAATIEAEIRAIVGPDVELAAKGFKPGFEFRHDTPLFDALATAMTRHEPSAILLPALLTGGTDASWLNRTNLTIYGLSPMRPAPGPGPFELMHGHDERIAVSDVEFGTAVLFDATRILNGLPL